LEKLAGVLEESSHVTSKASRYMHSVDPPKRQPPEHQPHHNKFFFHTLQCRPDFMVGVESLQVLGVRRKNPNTPGEPVVGLWNTKKK